MSLNYAQRNYFIETRIAHQKYLDYDNEVSYSSSCVEPLKLKLSKV